MHAFLILRSICQRCRHVARERDGTKKSHIRPYAYVCVDGCTVHTKVNTIKPIMREPWMLRCVESDGACTHTAQHSTALHHSKSGWRMVNARSFRLLMFVGQPNLVCACVSYHFVSDRMLAACMCVDGKANHIDQSKINKQTNNNNNRNDGKEMYRFRSVFLCECRIRTWNSFLLSGINLFSFVLIYRSIALVGIVRWQNLFDALLVSFCPLPPPPPSMQSVCARAHGCLNN